MIDAEANGRRAATRHSRRDIVDVALALLDEHGLPDLTMRRIATALSVQPSALYWHYPNKQALLAAVSDRILEPATVQADPDEPWQDALVAVASRARDALLSYRDGAELVSSSFALGLSAFPPRALLADVAHRSGASPAIAATAANTVTHYVLGYAFHEQQRMHADSLGALSDAESLAADSAGTARPDDFADGLRLIVTGLTQQASSPAS